MARISHRRLLQLIEALEPAIRDAFMRAIAEMRNAAPVSAISTMIGQGRIDDVLAVLGFNTARFAELAEAVRTAYYAGGMQGVTEIPTLRIRNTQSVRSPAVRVRFDMRNPRAEQWLARESSRLVTDIVAGQRNAIRATVSEGMALGVNPRQTALNIVGRVGETGRRSGGILGLTEQQAAFVRNMRAELSDPAQMAGYFGRERRDRRFDARVRRAMESGVPLPQAEIDKIAGRYADRLLQLRGEMIARTESMAAFGAAREQAFRQAIGEGLLRPEHVKKIWSATMDRRTRDSHREMNGREVGIDDVFVTPLGSRMRYPCDTESGALAADVIACRCQPIYRVDMIAATLGG